MKKQKQKCKCDKCNCQFNPDGTTNVRFTPESFMRVVGLDFYHYGNNDKWWLHSWGNVYPIHKHIYGDENFSYEDYLGKNDWIDYNYGVMFGWNITKKFGIFTEYEKTKFWDKNLMYLKAGLNWQL